jgi:multiple sugar transport system substrate-binding protein
MTRHLPTLLVGFALLLAACGGAPVAAPTTAPAGDAAPTSAPAAGGEKITLRVWGHQNVAFNNANQEIINRFMEQNPNIEVKYETFPYDQYQPTLGTSMPAGTEADVLELFGTWVCSYARGGRLQEVPPEIMSYSQAEGMFFKAPLDGYYCDGKLYGMPNEFNLEYGGVLVNPELFAKHDVTYPPQWSTFNDLISDAKKMTESEGGTMTRAGFHAIGGDAVGFNFLSGIVQQGGDYFADDGKHFNFDTPEATNAIQMMVDWAQRDKVIDPVVFGTQGLPDAFFQGNVAIGYVGSWAAGTGRVDFPDLKFDYVTTPPLFGDTHTFVADAGWGKVVSKNTKYPAEAWKLARFMAVERASALTFNGTTGTIPALKELVDNPQDVLAQASWIEPTFKLLPNGRYLGDLTNRDQLFYEIILKHVNDAMQGIITAEEAAKNIDAEANAMVDAAP